MAAKRDDLPHPKKQKSKKHLQSEVGSQPQSFCFDPAHMKQMAKRLGEWELSRKKSAACSSSLPRSPHQVV